MNEGTNVKYEGARGTERPSHGRGFGNRGKREYISGEQRPILRGRTTILGNRENKKTIFRFLGNRGTSHFIQGNKGTDTPWEGLNVGNISEQGAYKKAFLEWGWGGEGNKPI